MILVDSSALIEFYRADGLERVALAVAGAIKDGGVAVNGIVMVEILAYARDEDIGMLEEDFSAFHFVETGIRTYEEASRLGRELRRAGVTVPATDLVIAASAIVAAIPMLHADDHFDKIALHCGLDARNAAKVIPGRKMG